MQSLKEVEFPYPGSIEINTLECQRMLEFGFDPYEESIIGNISKLIEGVMSGNA
jgi:hypothetical protein